MNGMPMICTFNAMINPTATLQNRPLLLLLLAGLNVIVIVVMQSFAASLKPFSIIAFEFAGSPELAHQMVNTWRENGVLNYVFFLSGFDYLFMITYSTFLWLACMHIAQGLTDRIANLLIVLAWLQPLAALLDSVENLALYQIISGSWKPVWPLLAAGCAAPKFGIVLFAVLACLFGSIYKIAVKK